MKLPPASSSPRAPKLPDHCSVCGAPRRDKEGIWMIKHPTWAHPACIGWSNTAFPYDWKLHYLRGVARRLIRAYRIVVKLGRYVAQTKQQWPASAHERVDQIKQGDSAVDEAIRQLKSNLDHRG